MPFFPYFRFSITATALFILGTANIVVGSYKLETTLQDLNSLEDQQVGSSRGEEPRFRTLTSLSSTTPFEEDEQWLRLETKKLQLRGRLSYYRTVTLVGKTLFGAGSILGALVGLLIVLAHRRKKVLL